MIPFQKKKANEDPMLTMPKWITAQHMQMDTDILYEEEMG